MAIADSVRLKTEVDILRKVATHYNGQTIDSIIKQLEARINEIGKQETISIQSNNYS